MFDRGRGINHSINRMIKSLWYDSWALGSMMVDFFKVVLEV